MSAATVPYRRPPLAPYAAAVTGVGLVTAAGTGADAAWHGVTERLAPAAGPRPELAGLPCDFFYSVTDCDPGEILGVAAQRLMDRFAQLAVIAAREAVADAGLDPSVWDSGRVGVVIGSAHGGLPFYDEQQAALTARGPRRVSPKLAPLSVVNGAASSVSLDLGVHGPSQAVSTACSSGTVAIGTAHQMLRSGACDIVIAGGAESTCTRLLIASACSLKAVSTRRDDPAAACRPFDTHRDGFVVGEGAGLLVLEHPDHARARGATVRAHVNGYGATSDALSAVAPDPEGLGIERALRAALADAGLSPDDVGHVNAHGTSTLSNDLIETTMLRRVLGESPLVTSTKAMTGHTLGAAGGIETALTVLALQHQRVPPTVNLDAPDPEIPIDVVAKEARSAAFDCAVKTSLGFGGHNAALVLTRA
ncbi:MULTISPECIES: beta-ketoacyl-[acyl-carrier-protein] synthase family protein [Streptomyces]|uniref:Beta-ketoacyl-[acyl-carrier-protein] synthase family protein n=1 Tax=Streptomyces californicus TaxID=67351 RepID=A0ABD7CR86_9ACTN|nr:MULTISPECIES: beta-ketoacyl-[acyl-carrier-protein] synthase family protein [Streptomyces]QRV30932.1 beta-ketoacyl-[acyl-carrier-protein] synthase family protein [Streptomyces californicus]QRV33459.1 beta-ketoacyl-[acyl-carrier-protein] synthase family protein [Streptomyces californicus]QRV44347.1 beta-ketoacyl-[acyl-carrier-protein] synthase family protein [Streptomyces californicus]QRV51036.1 beta-ketoacyl-[acyl-carrier-protein] synthase family protein [Streptomyces californicus]QRV53725.1